MIGIVLRHGAGAEALLTVVVALLSVWYLVRMLKLFRRRGYITRDT